MLNNDTVRARINNKIKAQATEVLATIGLTPSEAFRLMMTRIAMEKALPFEPHIPNTETLAAMKELTEGKGKQFKSIKSLMDDLNEDD